MWTKTSLCEALAARGLTPKKKLGQHFLVDPNFCRFIVQSAMLSPQAAVVEIGCGPGILTAHLAPACARPTAVEIDPDMAALCREAVGDVANVTILQQNILVPEGRIAIMWREERGEWSERSPALSPLSSLHSPQNVPCVHVFGNLPYNRSVQILVALLAWQRPIAQILAVVQREVGERMRAKPSTELYGPLSVVAQAYADVARVRAVPRTVFWPAPRVESELVRLRPAAEGRSDRVLRVWEMLQRLFRQRRKRLGAALNDMGVGADVASRVLAVAGVFADNRAEALPPVALARLAEALSIDAPRK